MLFIDFKSSYSFIIEDIKYNSILKRKSFIFFYKMMKKKEFKIVKKILNSNDKIANNMRSKFLKKKIYVLNIMSSPGSGKTTLLEKTLLSLMTCYRCAVIVGDICTSNDANRLAKTGATVVQINTDTFGGDCHLTASSIDKALKGINLEKIDLLIIENIGNLVCPAEFDVGEDLKIVVFSVTEGEDKPEKYPLMFRLSDVVLINKIDLLPYLDFSMMLSIDTLNLINSNMLIFKISSKSGEGLIKWTNWLKLKIKSKLNY